MQQSTSRTIKWSKWARRDLEKITTYWNEHNQSSIYSRRLVSEATLAADMISGHPQIGAATYRQQVFKKIVAEHFLLIYRVTPGHITMLRFWDTRQNPRKLKHYLD